MANAILEQLGQFLPKLFDLEESRAQYLRWRRRYPELGTLVHDYRVGVSGRTEETGLWVRFDIAEIYARTHCDRLDILLGIRDRLKNLDSGGPKLEWLQNLNLVSRSVSSEHLEGYITKFYPHIRCNIGCSDDDCPLYTPGLKKLYQQSLAAYRQQWVPALEHFNIRGPQDVEMGVHMLHLRHDIVQHIEEVVLVNVLKEVERWWRSHKRISFSEMRTVWEMISRGLPVDQEHVLLAEVYGFCFYAKERANAELYAQGMGEIFSRVYRGKAISDQKSGWYLIDRASRPRHVTLALPPLWGPIVLLRSLPSQVLESFTQYARLRGIEHLIDSPTLEQSYLPDPMYAIYFNGNTVLHWDNGRLRPLRGFWLPKEATV